MGKIQILPKQLVSRIAAGEVVERPASVLKELIENALDAEASQIDIAIEQAGRKKIVVRDNGIGMDKDDVVLAAHVHATSKIQHEKDLESIGTLGFRGEALASIAAVSRLTILSKPEDQTLGTKVVVEEGLVGEPENAGAPTGTTVMVETLFAKTPARQKFLKTPGTEFRHIMKVVTNAALARPDVGFTLTHNDKTILELPKGSSMQERVQELLGERLLAHFIPLSRSSPHIAIDGFIGTPQIAGHEKDKQYLFINGRPVASQLVSRVVKDAFGGLLEPRVQPVFIFFLTLPTHSVDVNIHPRKETVRFVNDRTVAVVIERSVARSLEKHDLKYVIKSEEEQSLVLNDSTVDRGMDTYTAHMLKDMMPAWHASLGAQKSDGDILQIHNLYLLTQTPNGLLLIDQHAAHERILYEEFKEAFKLTRDKQETIELDEPIVFDLPQPEAIALDEHNETFAKLGFDIDHFGDTTFKVRQVPLIFKDRNIPALLSEILDGLINENGSTKIDSATERTLSFLACRSAIKAGDYLTPLERSTLLEKLSQCPTTGYTCPHGRPTQIEITLKELERMFKRR